MYQQMNPYNNSMTYLVVIKLPLHGNMGASELPKTHLVVLASKTKRETTTWVVVENVTGGIKNFFLILHHHQ